MTGRTAYSICDNINDDRIERKLKIEAIEIMANMVTHMGITKDSLIEVIKWLMEEIKSKEEIEELENNFLSEALE